MTFEDYDKINIFCSVYFAAFGLGYWKYKVSWCNARGEIESSNFGEAGTREQANEAVLELAKNIYERGYLE